MDEVINHPDHSIGERRARRIGRYIASGMTQAEAEERADADDAGR